MTDTLEPFIQQAAALLRPAARVAVLTGAGVSQESGVPTFRDALDGLWARYDPQELATAHAFQRQPQVVWEWYAYRRARVQQVQPNPGHHALAALQQRGAWTLVTQNVDDLHERAGSTGVLHVHGLIAETKCFYDCQGSPTLVDLAALNAPAEQIPPLCPHCGRWLRPNVVWFGEMLPTAVLTAAQQAFATCEVALVIGTSGLVEPAASLPRLAAHQGARLIEINPDETPLTRLADVRLPAPSGSALPRLRAALEA